MGNVVKIDFAAYTSFSATPVWWRNFVSIACKDLSSTNPTPWEQKLVLELSRYNCEMIDSEEDHDIDYLVFETDEDFLAFRLRWM